MNAIDLANEISATLAKGDAAPGGMCYSVIDGVLKLKLSLEDVDLNKIRDLDERVQDALTLSFNTGPMVVRVDLNRLKEGGEKKVAYKVVRECISCGNEFSVSEVTKEDFDKILEEDPEVEVSVEGDTDYIRYQGTCRGCREEYESSQD